MRNQWMHNKSSELQFWSNSKGVFCQKEKKKKKSVFIIQILTIKDRDGLFLYSLTARIYRHTSKAIFFSKQNIYIVSYWNPNYTSSPLKNRGDVLLSPGFLSAEFFHGPFHTLEALSSMNHKRRQNGNFLLFQFGFFLARTWCPEMPAMSSTDWAEASKAECQHMDSSSTNLVHNSVIKPKNRTGHLTHQCYCAQRLFSEIDDRDSLEFPAAVTGWANKSRKYFLIRSWSVFLHQILGMKSIFFFFFSFEHNIKLSCSLISWIWA